MIIYNTELQSLAILENIQLVIASEYSDETPFLVVDLKSTDDARKLISRAILIKEISLIISHDETFEQLLENVKQIPANEFQQFENKRFKFTVQAFGSTISIQEQVALINQFSFLPFKGIIDLKTPQETFMIYCDHGLPKIQDNGLTRSSEKPMHVYFSHLVSYGNRNVVNIYDLKKRKYLGTTSMDAELSLVMANQALVTPGSLVLDPFVGTGSFLVSCSHFGGYTMGSDIDGRQIRGKGNLNVDSNIKQYNLESRVIGTIVSDFAHHPWRKAELWDAIVCDPPYGVRAGAKKIYHDDTPVPLYKENGELRYPDTKGYEMDDLVIDLVEFSARFLVIGGRLVFWLPTVTGQYTPEDIPKHSCMKLISTSAQCFGKWSRILITMEKINSEFENNNGNSTIKQTGHSGFRDRYFDGFS